MIKYFNNLKIEYKLMLSHLVLIAIPTIVIIFLYGTQLQDIIFTDTIAQEQALADQTSLTLNSTLEQVAKAANSIKEQNLLKELSTPNTFSPNWNSIIEEELPALTQLMITQMEGDLITNICIYCDNLPSYVYENTKDGVFFKPISESRGTYWSGIFNSSNKYELYCPSFYLSTTEISELGDLSYILKLSHNELSDTPIYIAIYFSTATFNSILSQGSTTNSTLSYIMNERDSVVAASDIRNIGTYIMDYETIVDTALSSNSFTTKQVLGEVIYTGCYRVAASDWYMVSILPIKPLESKGVDLIIKFTILYLILLIVAFLIASKLSSSITIRIKLLKNQMERVLGERPEKMSPSIIKDEIGELIDTYNYMSDEMNSLLDEQAKSAEILRISEFHALQAQINPHFLYNTMDMINWLSQSGQNKQVTEAIQSLSKFYKLTLSKKSIITTIEDEVEHVSLYVKLQNMRYENRIDFVVDIPDELMEYELPKLTLQPVVENAILHGILETETGTGLILITGWLENNSIILLVSDDGVGITPDKLPYILDGTMSSKNGSNIGIYNTHQRLQTLYGKNSGLTYKSTLGVGTEVEIKIIIKSSDYTYLQG